MHLVNHKKQLSFLHHGALVNEYLRDGAAHLRSYLHGLPAAQRGRIAGLKRVIGFALR